MGRADPSKAAAIDRDVQAQMRAFGVDVEIDREPDEVMDVWAKNWPSVVCFFACATQWRVVAGLSGLVWLGLDYTGVEVVLRQRAADSHVFADIQAMEQAALAAFSEVCDDA